jgi:uncharacterized OB-fold protein
MGVEMARPIVPVPDPVSKPFWDACNEGKLIVQYCSMCDRRQFPPEAACRDCGFNFHLSWQETSGRAKIVGYSMTFDSRLVQWHPKQPFINAIVALEEDPLINFHSNLEEDFGANIQGDPDIPVGATVEVMFVEAEPGVMIPEWKIVS